MNSTKSIFASKTFWASLIPIALAVLSFAGVKIPAGDNTALIEGLALIGGGIVAIIGRISATEEIG